jgi:hypothetical protein
MSDPIPPTSAGAGESQGDQPSEPIIGAETARALVGRPAIYRLGFNAMLIVGFPDQVVFESQSAIIVQQLNAVTVRRTRIIQEPSLGLTFRKHSELLELGQGIPKTVCHIAFDLSDSLPEQIRQLHDEATSLVGALAAVIDERLALEELFEDVILLDPETKEEAGRLDAALAVRSFMPRVFDEVEDRSSQTISDVMHRDPTLGTAGRWYLRGAQQGPSPDAIVSFWVAVEALFPDARGKQVVRTVEAKLAETAFAMDDVPVPIGKLYGIRGAIVHEGNDNPALLREAYYSLEAVTRHLIRARADVVSDWPALVDANVWPEPIRTLVDNLRSRPQTWWE